MTTLGTAVAVVVVTLTVGQWTVAATAIWRRWTARRGGRPASDFAPRCAVIMPSKGGGADLEGNLRAHLRMAYPDFELVVAVESEDDAGVPILRRLAAEDARLRWVVAGLTPRGCQQNHNMLAGVAAVTGTAEVLAFADNDFAPGADWLARLVAPLADGRVTVTSGYRWLRSPASGPAGYAQVAMNLAMYGHFLIVNVLWGRVLWGGSFALRAADFDELEVATCWRDAVSDDMTLAARLVARGRRTWLVPGLLVESEAVLAETSQAVAWYGRQLLNVRVYDFATWVGFVGLGYLLVTALLFWPVVALALRAIWGGSWTGWGGGAALGIYLSEMVTMATLAAAGSSRRTWGLVVGAPWWRLMQVAGWVRSAGRLAIEWSGVVYRLDRRGRVIEIVRGRRGKFGSERD